MTAWTGGAARDEAARDEARRHEAARHVARLRAFYVHVVAYLLGNATNVVANAMTRGPGGSWWFQWVLLAWSVALAVHALVTLGHGVWLGPAWEERATARYLAARRGATRP